MLLRKFFFIDNLSPHVPLIESLNGHRGSQILPQITLFTRGVFPGHLSYAHVILDKRLHAFDCPLKSALRGVYLEPSNLVVVVHNIPYRMSVNHVKPSEGLTLKSPEIIVLQNSPHRHMQVSNCFDWLPSIPTAASQRQPNLTSPATRNKKFNLKRSHLRLVMTPKVFFSCFVLSPGNVSFERNFTICLEFDHQKTFSAFLSLFSCLESINFVVREILLVLHPRKHRRWDNTGEGRGEGGEFIGIPPILLIKLNVRCLTTMTHHFSG